MEHFPWLAGRFVGILAVALLITGASGANGYTATSSSSACQSWTGVQPPSPGTVTNALAGTAVLSSCDVWVVGSYGNQQGGALTLIEHWSESSWTVAPSPDPGNGGNFLSGVSAASPDSIWAVGDYFTAGEEKTLILHWNGSSWKQVPSPSPGRTANLLTGVSAVSARDVWAVGYYSSDTNNHTLILRWNGARWARVPSPDPGPNDVLAGVAAISGASAWGVGSFGASPFAPARPLILRWNGSSWRKVTAPSPGSSSELSSVAATSAVNAWAVGDTSNSTGARTLILRWNGATWTRTASPNPGSTHDDFLKGTATTSAANAWAVGAFSSGVGDESFILHWNGSKWAHVPSPHPGLGSDLSAVAASSSRNAWAVGAFTIRGIDHAFAIHCC